MVSVIVAVANNGILGKNNSLLWHISEDMQMFRRVTSGHPVIMGRKTFESLGRPLPCRPNVVITRRKDYSPEGVETVGSLGAAVAMFPAREEIFVIGGGEIYRQAMLIADKFYLTRIYADYEGDTRFPDWDPAGWTLSSSEYHDRGRKFPHPFEFFVYERK